MYYLMPRRVPLRADLSSLPICCPRREPTTTPLRGPCAYVYSKPWYHCGCTKDTPCRLRDAGSICRSCPGSTRTEPPVKTWLSRQDMGHLLTESCSDVHLCVGRCRAGNGDCCCRSMEAVAKLSNQTIKRSLALSLLSSMTDR